MNEEYFEQIKNLCKACGLSIDKIAKQFNVNQNLVAKLFMETMQAILDNIEKGNNNEMGDDKRSS